MSNAERARKRAEIERYRTCLDQYADPTPFSAFEFERVREELDALSPYRCSARPGRDCIQDAKWSEFARIATPEAVAFVRERDTWLRDQQLLKYRERRKLTDFINAFAQLVETYNRSVQ